MFWSGETLKERLKTLIDPFSPDRVDCAAYTLSIGSEVYVSPSSQSVDPEKTTIRQLSEGEAFSIPPGQFGFLLTEEIVTIPSDTLAFISIRAKTKFRGLVNVSGFHVDPGYRGQLTFAVFNAGPVQIHLKRGQSIFLIWYANLDHKTISKKDETIQRGIDPNVVIAVSGELQSFASVSKKIEDVEEALSKRVHAIEKEQMYYRVLGGVALAVVITATVNFFGGLIP